MTLIQTNNILICATILIVISSRTYARSLDRQLIIITNPELEQYSGEQLIDSDHPLIRHRRQSSTLADYYNNYYRNYYANIARKGKTDDGNDGQQQQYRPTGPSADRFDRAGNSLDDFQGSNQYDGDFNSNRYQYTPLFQYKSTQQKRHKLFVPNLFG